MSAPSLYIESTDSMIYATEEKYVALVANIYIYMYLDIVASKKSAECVYEGL